MKTILEIRFLSRSISNPTIYQTRKWEFQSKKEAKKFAKTAYLSGYLIDKVLFTSWNASKKCFKNELK